MADQDVTKPEGADGQDSKPSPAENDVPDDKGEEEIEEYGSRTDDSD